MNEFLKLIEKEFNQYRKYVLCNKISDSIKMKIADLIIYSPNQTNSFLSSFEDIYPYQSEKYTKILKELFFNFNIAENSFYYSQSNINEAILHNIQESLENKRNFIYLYKNGKKLTNFVNKIRNSLAHGNFYIMNNRIVMWNINKNKNVTFFANLGKKNFKFIHDTLMQIILNPN